MLRKSVVESAAVRARLSVGTRRIDWQINRNESTPRSRRLRNATFPRTIPASSQSSCCRLMIEKCVIVSAFYSYLISAYSLGVQMVGLSIANAREALEFGAIPSNLLSRSQYFCTFAKRARKNKKRERISTTDLSGIGFLAFAHRSPHRRLSVACGTVYTVHVCHSNFD